MTPEKKYTEREMILAQRDAFVNGGTYGSCVNQKATNAVLWKEAAECYPLPKVTRPRVVMDPYAGHFGVASDQVMVYWKVCGDNVVSCDSSGAVLNHEYPYQRAPLRVKLWADLLANPTEEVEDVG